MWIVAAVLLLGAAATGVVLLTRSKPAPTPVAAVVVDAAVAPPAPDAARPPPDAAQPDAAPPPPPTFGKPASLLPEEPPSEGIAAVFEEKASRIDECARRSGAIGRVVMKIQIRPDGWVNAVSVVGSLDPELSRCLSRIVDASHFPESVRGLVVTDRRGVVAEVVGVLAEVERGLRVGRRQLDRRRLGTSHRRCGRRRFAFAVRLLSCLLVQIAHAPPRDRRGAPRGSVRRQFRPQAARGRVGGRGDRPVPRAAPHG